MGRTQNKARRHSHYMKNKQSVAEKLAIRDRNDKKVSLDIAFLNVDHLSGPTFYDVVTTVETKSPDIVFLLETFRTVEDSHEDINIPGYTKYEALRSEVAEDRNGGGIAAYCKLTDGVHFSRLSMECDSKEEQFVEKERIWVEVKNDKNKRTAVCGIYFGCETPDDRYGVWNDLMYARIQKEVIDLRAKGYRVILVGDFNGWVGNALKEGGIPGNRAEVNKNGKKFLEFLFTVEMVHVNGATRTEEDWSTRLSSGLWTRQRGSSASILDYAVVAKEFMNTVCSLEVGSTGSGSDHNWMFLKVQDSFTRQKRIIGASVKKKVWDIKEDQSWDSFACVLTNSLHHVDTASISSLGRGLSGSLLAALRSEIGMKEVGPVVRRKTLPRSMVQEIKLKKRLEGKYKSAQAEFLAGTGGSEASVKKSEDEFGKQKVRVQQLVSLFKSMRRKDAAKKCEGHGKAARKGFWSFVSQKEKKSSEIYALIDPQSGVLKCDPTDVKVVAENFLRDLFKGSFEPIVTEKQTIEEIGHRVNELDHDYCKSGGEPGRTLVPAPPPYPEHDYAKNPAPQIVSLDHSCSLNSDPKGFCEKEFEPSEVENAAKTLKAGKAVGWDSIPNEAVKNAGAPFFVLLTILFNMIRLEGVLPTGWNRGRMVLVHKRGAVENIMNYRPLTVVISLCGVLSRVLNARLTDAVEASNLLGEIQNGFRRGRCCADNNFVLSTILWKARAMGRKVYCAYVDLFKAYDTVDRDILWNKMRKLGFGDHFIRCLQALYLGDSSSATVAGKETRRVFQRRGLRQGCRCL